MNWYDKHKALVKLIRDAFEVDGFNNVQIPKDKFPVGTRAMDISEVCFSNEILMKITHKQFWFKKTDKYDAWVIESDEIYKKVQMETNK